MSAPSVDVTSLERFPPPTLHIDLQAVRSNTEEIRQHTHSAVMAVVKADGYGHGAVSVARAAADGGATWFGTTDLADARALREAGISGPVLTWLHPQGIDVDTAVRHQVDVALASPVEAGSVVVQIKRSCGLDAFGHRRPTATPLRVHLHLDTGMGRGGCPQSDWGEILDVVVKAQARGLIRVVGLMGHLARADEADPVVNAPAAAAIRRARTMLRHAGVVGVVTHLGSSAAALTDPGTHYDLVRTGAALVGIDPSGRVGLTGAATLTAPIVHVAEVPAGTTVGYGARFTTDRASTLCTVAIGYADGIPREISTAASVAIGHTWHRIVGRVSMDQIVVDTGSTAPNLGTSVTIFGPAASDAPTIHDWAAWAGTIPHVIVTGIGPRVRRRIG